VRPRAFVVGALARDACEQQAERDEETDPAHAVAYPAGVRGHERF
jgi:hypothetical protein